MLHERLFRGTAATPEKPCSSAELKTSQATFPTSKVSWFFFIFVAQKSGSKTTTAFRLSFGLGGEAVWQRADTHTPSKTMRATVRPKSGNAQLEHDCSPRNRNPVRKAGHRRIG